MPKLLLDQRLKTVGKLEGRCGISGLCVATEEVLDLLEGPPLPGPSSYELRKHLRINCMTTPRLVSNGFLKSEVALHPRTRKSIRLLRYDQIGQFLAEYETVGRLSHRLATKPPYVVKQLRQKDMDPLAVERNMSVIYRRRDLPDELLWSPITQDQKTGAAGFFVCRMTIVDESNGVGSASCTIPV